MAKRHKLTQVRVAADLLGCGTSRIWMDPTAASKISAAITRADVRRLISSGAIKKLPATGAGSAGKRSYQMAGSRKGSAGARAGGRKMHWFRKVRPQRKLLAEAKPKLQPMMYRKTYRMIKGGAFRSRANLTAYLEAAAKAKKLKVTK